MKQKPKLTEIDVADLEHTAGTQTRVATDSRIVKEYASDMQAGANFPPITVFSPEGSQRYIVADGFHTLEAAREVGYESFPCNLYVGDVRDALEYALGCNDKHGLRRTNKDKRHAVEMALRDVEWVEWSNNQIAMLCHVDDKTVAKVRTDLALSGEIADPEKRKSGKTDAQGEPVEQPAKKPGTSKKKAAKKDTGNANDNGNRRDVLEVVGVVMSMPFDGKEAVERLKLEELKDEFEYCRDWFTEAAEAAGGE